MNGFGEAKEGSVAARALGGRLAPAAAAGGGGAAQGIAAGSGGAAAKGAPRCHMLRPSTMAAMGAEAQPRRAVRRRPGAARW